MNIQPITVEVSNIIITVSAAFELDAQGRRRTSGIMVPVVTMTKDGVPVSGSYGPVYNHPQVVWSFGREGFGPVSAAKITDAIATIEAGIATHNAAIRAEVAKADAFSISRAASERVNGSL